MTIDSHVSVAIAREKRQQRALSRRVAILEDAMTLDEYQKQLIETLKNQVQQAETELKLWADKVVQLKLALASTEQRLARVEAKLWHTSKGKEIRDEKG